MTLTMRRVMRATIWVLMMLVAVPGAHAQIGSGISGVGARRVGRACCPA